MRSASSSLRCAPWSCRSGQRCKHGMRKRKVLSRAVSSEACDIVMWTRTRTIAGWDVLESLST
eukprot:2355916-Rhodomonas_salina.2